MEFLPMIGRFRSCIPDFILIFESHSYDIKQSKTKIFIAF